jgi:hypothetical protein
MLIVKHCETIPLKFLWNWNSYFMYYCILHLFMKASFLPFVILKQVLWGGEWSLWKNLHTTVFVFNLGKYVEQYHLSFKWNPKEVIKNVQKLL